MTKEETEKKVSVKKNMEAMKRGMRTSLIQKKNQYIRETINGRYYLARTNMIAEQIHAGKILEKIDGCPKTEELMRTEYGLMKMQAIMAMRNAHFAKVALKTEFKLTEEDIYAIEEDYYNGKIIREDYDESYNTNKKQAGAVKSDK